MLLEEDGGAWLCGCCRPAEYVICQECHDWFLGLLESKNKLVREVQELEAAVRNLLNGLEEERGVPARPV